MKIEQSSMALNAAHDFSSERQLSEESTTSFHAAYSSAQANDPTASAVKEREKQWLLIERLTQRLIDLLFSDAAAKPVDLREILAANENGTGLVTGDHSTSSGHGMLCFEVTTQTTETLHEHETLQFAAQGKVCTADGRTLDFDLGLSLNRDFSCTRSQIHTDTVVMRDPLVVNFDGNACELSGKRFAFDLDVDGQSESIPGLGANSGFLALDRNQDGRITDGSELFGAKSGDGFADLAAFDQDRNGWIDESDPVYERLRIWRHNADGSDSLTSLRTAGIGAIGLDSATGSFALTDAENQMLARIRSSGVYLRETGGAGSVQQVDLSV